MVDKANFSHKTYLVSHEELQPDLRYPERRLVIKHARDRVHDLRLLAEEELLPRAGLEVLHEAAGFAVHDRPEGVLPLVRGAVQVRLLHDLHAVGDGAGELRLVVAVAVDEPGERLPPGHHARQAAYGLEKKGGAVLGYRVCVYVGNPPRCGDIEVQGVGGAEGGYPCPEFHGLTQASHHRSAIAARGTV